jgi:hypothetical protein
VGLLYFIETDKGTLTATDLRAAGLGYALEGDGVEARQLHDGPGGGRGVICVPQPAVPQSTSPPPAKFDRATQTWRRGPAAGAGGKFWVGFNNDARPGPDQLARARRYAGTPVRLLDDHDWIVPRCVAILEDRPPTLPYVFDLADDGQTVTASIDPRYTRLCDAAFDLWLAFSGQQQQQATRSAKLTGTQQVQLACDALAVNYRLSMLEAVGLLKLIGTEQRNAILRAMIDADEVEAAYFRATEEKKSPPPTPASASATSSGSPESSPATGPDSPPSPGS